MSAEVRKQVRRLVESLRGFDPVLLSGTDCAALAVAEKTCAGARARAAARAADCGAHRGFGYVQPADWLAKVSGTSVGEAKAALETAAVADAVPERGEALAEGSLSPAQAVEIARTEEARPGSAGLLLDVARRRGLQAVRDEGRRIRLAAVDPEELHRRQRAARSFRHWRDGEGMICFRGALAPEDGIAIVNRIDAEADRIRREARREGSAEPWEAHAADAFVSLTEGKGRGRSKGADVVIVCDIEAWRRGRALPGEPCHVVGGGPVPVSVAKELSRDAFLKAVVHDGVEIKSVKHFGRHIPAELRTALELGPAPGFEGVECAGGCGRRYGLEWDHRDPVANGGPTSFDNLDPRCIPCHKDKTERDRKAGLLGGGSPRAPGTEGTAARNTPTRPWLDAATEPIPKCRARLVGRRRTCAAAPAEPVPIGPQLPADSCVYTCMRGRRAWMRIEQLTRLPEAGTGSGRSRYRRAGARAPRGALFVTAAVRLRPRGVA